MKISLARWIVGVALAVLVAVTSLARDAETGKPLSVGNAAMPAYCMGVHNVGRLVLTVTNFGTIGDGWRNGVSQDCFTGSLLRSCEFPKGSGSTYMFIGSVWIGAVVRRDTLVSEGFDGWIMEHEFNPDPLPSGAMIHRSTLDPNTPDAISEQDFVCAYSDSFWDPLVTHRPLPVVVSQSSYAWSYGHTQDFVILNYGVRNSGDSTLKSLYFGYYVDGDVYGPGKSASGYTDDIAGFVQTRPARPEFSANCPYTDTLNLAWIADNDGDPVGGSYADPSSVPHVTGMRFLWTPSDSANPSFNWWVSNGDPSLDYGPQTRKKFRDLGTGGLGTPEGDRAKYWYMSNGEIDFDQAYSGTILQNDTIWIPEPAIGHGSPLAWGGDAKYVLSVGPFDLEPGQTLPLALAYIAGDNFHSDPNNFENNVRTSYNPDLFTANLDFDGLQQSADWAERVYDIPGYDTDMDGYAGKYHVCCTDSGDCDTVFYKGDGVPDYKPVVPPQAPRVWLEPQAGGVRVRWNGLKSETTKDILTGLVDFEGYRVYLARDNQISSYSQAGSYDREDYWKYRYVPFGTPHWEMRDNPFTREQLRCLYGTGAEPCDDVSFDPLAYTAQSPYVKPSFSDSIFYFAPVGANTIPGVTTTIQKVYPNAPYPSSLVPSQVDPDELTQEGYFKYFEYELTITSLLDTTEYWVSVTAFDFGAPRAGLPATEASVLPAAKSFWTPAGTTLVEPEHPSLPTTFSLSPAYPNPFNPETKIEFALPHNEHVRLEIFNPIGELVTTVVNQTMPAGNHRVTWNGKSSSGMDVASGVYLYRLSAGSFVSTRKMVLLR